MVSRIQQSLSFHDSPESFISSRLQHLSFSDPDSLPVSNAPNAILKAQILNRNVHIISSYKLCKAILNGDVSKTSAVSSTEDVRDDVPVFAAEPAYKQFMSAFFPGPNILLQDGLLHRSNKERWKRRMSRLVSDSSGLEDMVRSLTTERFVEPLINGLTRSTTIDLYDAMKTLSWDILFGVFLGLDRNGEDFTFRKAEQLQEDLLRGQFSLFPVSLRTPFWSSPRSRGLDAVKGLQSVLAERLERPENLGMRKEDKTSACPFMRRPREADQEDLNERELHDDNMIAHLLVFTSSIANKALASLLTAYLVNLFLWQNSGTGSLAHLVCSQQDESTKERMLKSILAETERLSPPVVGVMRCVKQDIVLQQGVDREDGSEYMIQKAHDTWLYLAGASRDPTVFSNPDAFSWDRYMSSDDDVLSEGFAFGGGVKKCLGDELTRTVCLLVARTILESSLSFEGTIRDQGVRHWLGWEKDVSLQAIARDLKQLPCQRPRKPVMVKVSVDR